jgi:hypothetical protein
MCCKRKGLGGPQRARFTLKREAIMAITVRAVEYFYTRVQNEPSQAYELLARLASEDINVLAFSAVPFGPNHVELTIFPEDAASLQALAGKLQDAGVRVYASSGVTDAHGHYGYVIYTKEGDHVRAEQALLA